MVRILPNRKGTAETMVEAYFQVWISGAVQIELIWFSYYLYHRIFFLNECGQHNTDQIHKKMSLVQIIVCNWLFFELSSVIDYSSTIIHIHYSPIASAHTIPITHITSTTHIDFGLFLFNSNAICMVQYYQNSKGIAEVMVDTYFYRYLRYQHSFILTHIITNYRF